MAEETLDAVVPPISKTAAVGRSFLKVTKAVVEEEQRDAGILMRTTEKAELDRPVPVEWTWLFFQLSRREVFCTRLVVHLIFVICATAIFQMLCSSTSFFAVQDSILEHTARAPITTMSWDRTFYDISSDAQWWDWVQHTLLRSILREDYFNGDLRANTSNGRFRNTVAMYNTQTAAIRFRQARVRDNSCTSPAPDSELGRSCWGPFSEGTQFSGQFGINYGNRFLTDMNRIQAAGSFGLGYGTRGHVVDIPLNQEVALNTTNLMKNGPWLNEQTRMISVETSWYNANLDISTYCRFQVDISPGGLFRPSVVIQSCRLSPYATVVDKVRACIEVLFLGMLIYYILEAAYYIRLSKTMYFQEFWNWLEVLVLIMYLVIVIWWLGFVASNKAPFEVVSSGRYNSRPDLSSVASYYDFMANMMSFTVVFACVKICKYLQVVPSIAQLWRVLERSTVDMVPFLIVFLLFTCGFTFAAHWIFGVILIEFASWTQSFATLLLTMVGGFPYAEMAKIAPFSAAIFTILWVLVIVMILANMFIAILTEWYCRIQSECCEEEKKLRLKLGDAAPISLIQVFMQRFRLQNPTSVYGDGPEPAESFTDASLEVSRMLTRANLQNVEHLRTAVLQEKVLVPEDLAQHFGWNPHTTTEFVNRVHQAVDAHKDIHGSSGDEPETTSSADDVAQQRLGDLQKTVAHLEEYLKQLREALHRSGVAPLQEGQSEIGYQVEPVLNELPSPSTDSHVHNLPGAVTEN